MILFFKVVHLVLKAVCKVHWSIIYPSKKSLFRCFRIWIHTTPGTASCDFRGVFLLMFVQKSFLTFGIKKRTPRQNFWTACSTFCHCGGDFHCSYDTWTDSCHLLMIYEIFGIKKFFVLWSWCCRLSRCVILFLLLFDNCFTSKRCRGVLYTDSTRWISLPRKRNCLQMIHTEHKRAVVCPAGSPHTMAEKSLNWVWFFSLTSKTFL